MQRPLAQRSSRGTLLALLLSVGLMLLVLLGVQGVIAYRTAAGRTVTFRQIPLGRSPERVQRAAAAMAGERSALLLPEGPTTYLLISSGAQGAVRMDSLTLGADQVLDVKTRRSSDGVPLLVLAFRSADLAGRTLRCQVNGDLLIPVVPDLPGAAPAK